MGAMKPNTYEINRQGSGPILAVREPKLSKLIVQAATGKSSLHLTGK